MAPPPVSIYVTSLTSQPKVRQNIELLRRSLRALEIPYTEHDLVMEEDAKIRWQRAKPSGQVIGLPGYLVGGEFIGTMDDFEYAAETSTLPTFLRQDTDLAANQSVGEAELERLMREMSDADLDALALEVEKGGQGKKADTSPPSTKSAEPPKPTPTSASAAPATALKDVNLTQDPVKGISTAAQLTIDTITQKASDLIGSLGGAEPHSGTADQRTTPPPSGSKAAGSQAKGDSAIDSPAELASPTQTEGGDGATRPRRMSKQEIAEKMANANSVEGLLASLDLAEGKDGKEKTD